MIFDSYLIWFVLLCNINDVVLVSSQRRAFWSSKEQGTFKITLEIRSIKTKDRKTILQTAISKG